MYIIISPQTPCFWPSKSGDPENTEYGYTHLTHLYTSNNHVLSIHIDQVIVYIYGNISIINNYEIIM